MNHFETYFFCLCSSLTVKERKKTFKYDLINKEEAILLIIFYWSCLRKPELKEWEGRHGDTVEGVVVSTWPFLPLYPPHAAPPHFSSTHMQTGPWGVFSPEVAICTCLLGMQWAQPPSLTEAQSLSAVCDSNCIHLACVYNHTYVMFFSACICLFVVRFAGFAVRTCCKMDSGVWDWLSCSSK